MTQGDSFQNLKLAGNFVYKTMETNLRFTYKNFQTCFTNAVSLSNSLNLARWVYSGCLFWNMMTMTGKNFLHRILTCNSHTIQFTLLKYKIQWFLVYSQTCTVVTMSFQNIFIIPTRNFILIHSNSCSPPLPLPHSPRHFPSTFCLHGFSYSGPLI